MNRDPVLAVDVVVPTVGRPSLMALLRSLAEADGPRPRRLTVVDDQIGPPRPLWDAAPDGVAVEVVVIRSGGRGPAAARNAGWRHGDQPWVAFLDDDVLLPQDWLAALAADLAACPDDVAASQGRIRVPRPVTGPPTDWERNVAGLESARWATADMAYRRTALEATGGFDERFPRAYREDADLGLRTTAMGWRILPGQRSVVHPVRPIDGAVSVRLQAGNADDALMLARHGLRWRQRAGVPRGRRPAHALTVAAGAAALVAAVGGRHRSAAVAAAGWAALTSAFFLRRALPGPRTPDELWRMAWTSVVIPPVAVGHYVRGVAALPWRLRLPGPQPARAGAVLFDRDGTLVRDVPYNGDPSRITPMPGARAAVARLRAAGIPVGVVSNQSGIGRGWLTPAQVEAVNARIDELIGPFDTWVYCPHAPGEACGCRKPAPGLIQHAAKELGVAPESCVVIGDIGADLQAAHAAGARAILVPTDQTFVEEIDAAPEVARSLRHAVGRVLGEPPVPVQVGQ